MHEFSLAQSLLQTAVEVATQNQALKITRINLKFGTFALVMEDQLRFCMDILKEENELTKEMEVIIKWEEGIIQCVECGYNGITDSSKENDYGMISSLKCPECQSYDTRVVKGMETYIEDIAIKSED
ncbi:MAG: hydrogenase maturation nickel metallochaperone HypA/HybF [Candidatus Kariarchaeaceae archaeon]|jgi:hydrogenase nickel incorporation protein HypA/HybF